jgi:hypothetical protein
MFNPFDNSYDKLNLEYTPFPAGRHVTFISEAILHESKTGKKAVEVTFTVHDPASPNKGKTLKFQRYWTSPNAIWRLANLCRCCHQKVEPFDISDENKVQSALLDQIVVIDVKHSKEVYNGKERTNVDVDRHFVLTSEETSRLREEYGDSMLPPLDGEESTPGGTGFGDDDIPF